MRRPAAVIAGLVIAAMVGLGVAALLNDRTTAFTLGVARATTIELAPKAEICQGPIAVPEGAGFDGVMFAIGTHGRPGPALDVLVHPAGQRDVLARASLAGGYPDIDRRPEHTVWTGAVEDRQAIVVCLVNRGRRPAFVYGDAGGASRATQATIDAQPIGGDMALDFERSSPRTLAALIPAMVDRAALFRAQIVGGWTYVLLALLVLLAVPALLIGAVRAAERDSA
jgi:hypothetical protein